MDTNKKNKIIAICITFVTVIVLAGITYTFFSSAVSNTNNEKFSTQTATMSLVFDDGDNGINATLNPGESVVKKFTIENTGTVDAYGKINWVDLVNTYTEGSLSWKLESSNSENGTYTKIKEDNVPTSNAQTTVLLRDGLLVPEGATLYYKLTITLNNLDDVDQTSDTSASMHSKFNLETGKPIVTAVQYIRNLVSGFNPSSTDVINISLEKNKYIFNFNGFILDNEEEYDTLDSCNDDLNNWFMQEYGQAANGICEQNLSTGKYNINASGDSSESTYYYDNQSSCQSEIQNVFFQNTSCIQKKINVENCNTFAYDGSTDNNLRYVGSNPCNYIEVNGVIGSIIGVMNNIDDGSDKNESRLKIITDNFGYLSWGETNNFDNSFIKNNSTIIDSLCMSDVVAPANRYLKSPLSNDFIMNSIYDIEKTTGAVYSGNPTSSIATYAPMNYSDYILSTGNHDEIDRTTFLNLPFDINYTIDSWIKHRYYDRGPFLTVNSNPVNNSEIIIAGLNWQYYVSSTDSYQYNPTFFLKADATILGGDGTEENPYVVGNKSCIDF